MPKFRTLAFMTLLFKCGVLIWLTLSSLTTQAQLQMDDPDWKESEATAPPALNRSQLIAIDMPHYVSLKFGIDPATLVLTPDGIARYVVVAVNTSGSVSAMYEGIRCATGQVKTYARSGENGVWSLVKEPLWRNLTGNLPSKHALALARQGVCDGGSATASSVADIIKNLKR